MNAEGSNVCMCAILSRQLDRCQEKRKGGVCSLTSEIDKIGRGLASLDVQISVGLGFGAKLLAGRPLGRNRVLNSVLTSTFHLDISSIPSRYLRMCFAHSSLALLGSSRCDKT